MGAMSHRTAKQLCGSTYFASGQLCSGCVGEASCPKAARETLVANINVTCHEEFVDLSHKLMGVSTLCRRALWVFSDSGERLRNSNCMGAKSKPQIQFVIFTHQ